jgi:predicted ATPase
MLSANKGQTISIQQPEVHLHPKAQAALGDLMHFLVVTESHRYIVETHSDYLIDRFRLKIKKEGKPADAQVVFFNRTKNGNRAESLEIGTDGQYPDSQPKAFREFFINEAISIMGI